VAAGCVAFSMMLAGPVLTLKDDRVLKGVDLRREGDLYMLVIAGGAVIPLPSEVVKTVEWVAEGAADDKGAPNEPIANMVTGKTEAEQQEADQRRAASNAEADAQYASQQAAAAQAAQANAGTDTQAVVNGAGVVLAGAYVTPPTAAQQLAVFGKPAEFPKDVVHFDGGQPSYWIMDPEQAKGSPSTFTPPSPNSTWVPTDGFAKGK
jgi:hypothetical protein